MGFRNYGHTGKERTGERKKAAADNDSRKKGIFLKGL